MNRKRLVRWFAIMSLIALPATGTLARRSDPPACPDSSYYCQPVCALTSYSCPSPIELLRQGADESR